MSNQLFETQHILDAQKMADGLLKKMQHDDPRSCLMALAICITFASKACGLSRRHLVDLLETVQRSLNEVDGDAAAAAQAAMSELILPGRLI